MKYRGTSCVSNVIECHLQLESLYFFFWAHYDLGLILVVCLSQSDLFVTQEITISTFCLEQILFLYSANMAKQMTWYLYFLHCRWCEEVTEGTECHKFTYITAGSRRYLIVFIPCAKVQSEIIYDCHFIRQFNKIYPVTWLFLVPGK